MSDKEPRLYPSRNGFFYNPGVPDRQMWAIGMVVVQWGMTEVLRDQITYDLIGDDTELTEQYEKQRHSSLKTAFWKRLVSTKMTEPKRSQYLDFVTRFESLNNKRDDIIHRLWGGGMQPDTLGAVEGAPVTDAALHRNRDEKLKSKSNDFRANIRWRLSFNELRDIARQMSVLNKDIFQSFLDPAEQVGAVNVFAAVAPTGKLVVGVGIASSPPKGDPDRRD